MNRLRLNSASRLDGVSPTARPMRLAEAAELRARLATACGNCDGVTGAHCIHELWMRGEFAANIEPALQQLWHGAAESIPDWLPMRHIDWLPTAYEVSERFAARRRGAANIYLVLLDYSDSRPEPYGVYVGMTRFSPSERFDQHKAGIRAAGSVLRRGIELLTGPVLHLQGISRPEATQIEERLAAALGDAGLFVQGGH
ncbi:MAG TPA: hypothetical protein VK130_10810 [Steroidobacteraceae bacterium]|nr:hypothetical protein [Steroidobacteraceae bacterium]